MVLKVRGIGNCLLGLHDAGTKKSKLWVGFGNCISHTNNVLGGWLPCFGKGARHAGCSVHFRALGTKI